MRAIDQAFEVWATRVESLVGRPIDRKLAREAFECYEPPKKDLTAQEFAREMAQREDDVIIREALWGDLSGYPPYTGLSKYNDPRPDPRFYGTLGARPPQIWKSCAPAQRILNWFYWLLRR